MIHALTIDLEDYYMVSAFEPTVKKSEWDSFDSRIVKSTECVLSILDDFNTKATFFTVGWLAHKFPALIRRVVATGHEIACHGYLHQLVYNMTPHEFRKDVHKTKQILEHLSGKEVIGYRAPSFSLTEDTPWAWDILKTEGIVYDASVLPAYHARGGLEGASRFPYRLNGLIEFPMSTMRIGSRNMSFAGGGYFRLYPYPVIRFGIESCEKEGQPAIVYMHPWEFDPGQPRLKAPWFDTFKHYVNLNQTEKKFKRLLHDYKFDTVRGVLSRSGALN